MARSFDGSSSIQGSIGGLVGAPGGAHTIAVIGKRGTSGTDMVLVSLETSANSSKLAMEWGSTNNLNLVIGSASKDTTVDVATSDGWVCAVVNRASGTSTPRGHKYVYDTDSWTHADAAAATGGDSSDMTAGRIQLAQWQNTARFNGDIAVAAVWKRSLSDAEVEALAFSLQAWYHAAPDALWVLDQQATGQTVIDATGNGANQTGITGTSVSTASVPVFNYGAGPTAAVGHAGGAQSAAIGTATETDTAVAVGRAKSKAVTTATETDTAIALARVKARTVGLAAETDTAVAVARVKTKAVGTATSTEAAQPLSRVKTRTIGTAAEADSALTFGVGGAHAVGTAGETDTALAFGRLKTRAFSTATSTETALPLARAKTRAVGTAAEVDAALAVAGSGGSTAPVATRTLTDGPRRRGVTPLDSTRGTPGQRRRR